MADGQDKGNIFGGLTQMVVPSPAPVNPAPPAPMFDHLGSVQVAPPTAKSTIPSSPSLGQKVQDATEDIIPLAREARTLQEQVVNPSKSGQQANELVHNTLAHPENLAMGGIESEEAGAIKGALEGAVERYISHAEPNYVYRSRDIGEQGVPAFEDSHAQLTSSEEQAHRYAQPGQRDAVTGKPQEVVRVDLNKLRPSDYSTKKQDEGVNWHKLNRDIPEELVEKMPVDYFGAGKQVGVEFRGIQKGIEGQHPGLAIFQDNRSGTSVAVRLDEWSPAKLAEHVAAARARMKTLY